jgi:hypothetical protein
MESLDIIYLLALVGGTILLITMLGYLQKLILSELEIVLCKEDNPRKYLQMLDSKRMEFLFRKGSLLLLRLNGCLVMEDEREIQNIITDAETVKMRQSEKLLLHQKLLNYFLMNQNREQATHSYQVIIKLLEKEKDEKLKEILEDTRLLYGVYVDKDTGLIPKLLLLSKKQSGKKRGITDYRLAKLYWYTGNEKKAMEHLKNAKENLDGTEWSDLIRQAMEQPEILEQR